MYESRLLGGSSAARCRKSCHLENTRQARGGATCAQKQHRALHATQDPTAVRFVLTLPPDQWSKCCMLLKHIVFGNVWRMAWQLLSPPPPSPSRIFTASTLFSVIPQTMSVHQLQNCFCELRTEIVSENGWVHTVILYLYLSIGFGVH
jgi:hypothetical protein